MQATKDKKPWMEWRERRTGSQVEAASGGQSVGNLQCNRKHRIVTQSLDSGTYQVSVSGVQEGTVNQNVPSTFFVHTLADSGTCTMVVTFTSDGSDLTPTSVDPDDASSTPGVTTRTVKAGMTPDGTYRAMATITPC